MKRLLRFWTGWVLIGVVIFGLLIVLTKAPIRHGSQLLFHSYLNSSFIGGDLHVYDVEHHFEMPITLSPEWITNYRAGMSPDHQYLVVSEHSGTMGIWGLVQTQWATSTHSIFEVNLLNSLPLLWNDAVTYWGQSAWSPIIEDGVMRLAFVTNNASDIDFHEWRYANIWVVDVPTKQLQSSDVLPANASSMIPLLGQAIMATRHRLTKPNANDGDMAWSPDGRHMAFISDRDGDQDIYILDTDGIDKNVRRVTDSVVVESSPSWSPDGEWLVFAAQQGEYSQLYVISTSGGEARQLTFGLFDSTQPSWSPNGEYIAYRSNQFITLIRPDGGEPQQLFMGDNPSWVP